MSDAPNPFHVFNFEVTFTELTSGDGRENGSQQKLCSAAFSEVTGLEATMEPKVIKEGGRNFGSVQLAGVVTCATVVLKRGITGELGLWEWFNAVASGAYGKRRNVYVRLLDSSEHRRRLRLWKLHRALPIKLKSPDFNATAANIGIEELHLAHEGLELVLDPATGDGAAASPPSGATP